MRNTELSFALFAGFCAVAMILLGIIGPLLAIDTHEPTGYMTIGIGLMGAGLLLIPVREVRIRLRVIRAYTR